MNAKRKVNAIMESNWSVSNNTPITEYEVDSKGIRHIRTTFPDKRSKDDPKPSQGDEKRKKSD